MSVAYLLLALGCALCLGVSQAMHLLASALLLTMHVSHSQLPAGFLNSDDRLGLLGPWGRNTCAA